MHHSQRFRYNDGRASRSAALASCCFSSTSVSAHARTCTASPSGEGRLVDTELWLGHGVFQFSFKNTTALRLSIRVEACVTVMTTGIGINVVKIALPSCCEGKLSKDFSLGRTCITLRFSSSLIFCFFISCCSPSSRLAALGS